MINLSLTPEVASDIATQLKRIADALDRAILPIPLPESPRPATLINVDPGYIAEDESEKIRLKLMGLPQGSKDE